MPSAEPSGSAEQPLPGEPEPQRVGRQLPEQVLEQLLGPVPQLVPERVLLPAVPPLRELLRLRRPLRRQPRLPRRRAGLPLHLPLHQGRSERR